MGQPDLAVGIGGATGDGVASAGNTLALSVARQGQGVYAYNRVDIPLVPLKERAMAIAESIGNFLRRERVPYTTLMHERAYTAQQEAAVAHVPGRHWAKTVVCFADDEPIQAVVPADLMVDLERLRVLAGARAVRKATEDEMVSLYPGCEAGAMPPFGPLYGQRVFVDTTLVAEPDMVFNAGTHTDAICMHYSDFVDLAKPRVGVFATQFHH
jgi:Ala-tRNA(Pro) deacylase